MKTDTEIQTDVMEEFKWEPFLDSAEIGVAVKHGIVTLSGAVNSYAKKIAAEKAAKRVAGVKAVAEEIEVTPLKGDLRNDAEIAETIINTLKWHTSIEEEKIKVKVENGWVTLEGEVNWIFEKNIIADAIMNLIGVRGITNLVHITPMVEPKEIKRKINAVFHRYAALDADGINVKTDGHKVTLTGKVHSFSEKMAAGNAAAMAPGITEVINKIEIETSVFA